VEWTGAESAGKTLRHKKLEQDKRNAQTIERRNFVSGANKTSAPPIDRWRRVIIIIVGRRRCQARRANKRAANKSSSAGLPVVAGSGALSPAARFKFPLDYRSPARPPKNKQAKMNENLSPSARSGAQPNARPCWRGLGAPRTTTLAMWTRLLAVGDAGDAPSRQRMFHFNWSDDDDFAPPPSPFISKR
jgi:hypothetical protein